jgi:hypothetical protein
MAGERNYLRVPPDGAGKRVRMKHTAQIFYNNKITHTWMIDHYHLSSSSGPEIQVHAWYELTATTGVLEVHYPESYVYEGTNPSVGQAIVTHTGTTVANITEVRDVFVNTNHIIGYDNPENGVDVDAFGSLNIRFSEGRPQLDAFGKLRTAGSTIIGDYTFANDTLPAVFSSKKVGSATITHDTTRAALLLTNTTSASDVCSHTSNTYHHYTPGSSHLFIGTVALGAETTNVTRSWGMFDADNGFLFQQVNGVLKVTIRNNSTGSIVNTTITQADFDNDRCDGTGISGMNIDLTKDNIYWIDVQWLGAGRARFGTYHLGQRVVMHEYYHGNTYAYPITRTGSLPVCYSQQNTGTPGGTVEMRAFCAAVYTETEIDVQMLGRTALATFTKRIPSGTSINSYTYLCTLSPKPVFSNGLKNRSLYWPSALDAMAYDSDGNDARVAIDVYANPVIAGLNFSSVEPLSPINTVDIDSAATFYGGGIHTLANSVKGNLLRDLHVPDNNMFVAAFKNFSENGGTRTSTISNITAANPAVVTVATSIHLNREGEPLVISGITGTMSAINGNTVFMKINGLKTAELYQDSALSTGVNTSGLSYTSGGTLVGDYGPRVLFTVVAKPLTPFSGSLTTKPIYVKFMLSWREIAQ